MGRPAARITDLHMCSLTPPPGLPVVPPCAIPVLIGGMPAARMTDLCACVGPPPANVDAILMGSPTVLIGGLPAARIGDPTVKGGVITTGFPTVLIGEAATPAPVTLFPSVVCMNLAADKQRIDEAIAMAGLAGAAYGDENSPLPEGWERATQADLEALGLHDGEHDLTRVEGSEFRADVFVRTDPSTGERDYTIAFKGTSPTSGEDWGTNARQGLGMETAYYSQAAEIGRTASAAQPGRVQYTGHSLGGGLASAASASSGDRATTFNAAGLNADTVPAYSGAMGDLPVDSYFVRGDILSSLQDNTFGLMPEAAGTRRPLAPASNLAWTDVAGAAVGGLLGGLAARGARLHLMDAVDGALAQEAERIRSEQARNGCL